MATILDLGILEYFTPIFVFLFIFSVMYAILDKTGILGESKALKSLISFTLALMFLLTNELMQIVTIMTPWVIILLIAVLFIMMFFLFVGAKPEDIAKEFTNRTIVWIILLVLMGIFGYAMTQVYGEDIHTIYGDEVPEEDALNQSIGKIIFHPKVLGMVMLLIIAAQAVRLIVGNVAK